MTAPDWFAPIPAAVAATVIRACEVVATGDRSGGIEFLAASGIDPLQLHVAAVRVFGTLFMGGGEEQAKFDRLRHELLRVAQETDAPSAEVNLALEVCSSAQFWASGDVAALLAVTVESQFSACDCCSVAVQLVGQLLDDELGPETFHRLRKHFGIEDE